MTTKQKFEVEDPPVVVLANGRFAYRVQCPWEGKGGKTLYAFKFCSAEAHRQFCAKQEPMEVEEPVTMKRTNSDDLSDAEGEQSPSSKSPSLER